MTNRAIDLENQASLDSYIPNLSEIIVTSSSTSQIPQCRPFVKWLGGKVQLIPKFEKYIPDSFNNYFEPFLGAGALFFYLVSTKQLKITSYISDTNVELINAYKIVRDNVEELINLLKIHDTKFKATRLKYFLELRGLDLPELPIMTDIESAARFITLNKTCFNGVYRVNGDGRFNVPIGDYKNPVICDSKNLRDVSMVLRHTDTHIFTDDYREALKAAQEGDFCYLDPPYKEKSKTANFTGYTKSGFTDKDQIELHETFKNLTNKGCKVMLSNSDTPFVKDLYKEFKESTTQIVDVKRAVNSNASKRTGETELLIRNYEK